MTWPAVQEPGRRNIRKLRIVWCGAEHLVVHMEVGMKFENLHISFKC